MHIHEDRRSCGQLQVNEPSHAFWERDVVVDNGVIPDVQRRYRAEFESNNVAIRRLRIRRNQVFREQNSLEEIIRSEHWQCTGRRAEPEGVRGIRPCHDIEVGLASIPIVLVILRRVQQHPELVCGQRHQFRGALDIQGFVQHHHLNHCAEHRIPVCRHFQSLHQN